MTDHSVSSTPSLPGPGNGSGNGNGSDERTPLIRKSHSVTIIPSALGSHDYENGQEVGGEGYSDGEDDDGPKGREVEVYKPGKSTFTQTVRPSLHF